MNQQDLDRAKQLIPGFLKNSLAPSDLAWMAHFLSQLQAHDPPQAQSFSQEMQWVEKTQAQMQTNLPQLDVETSWHQLSQKLTSASDAEIKKTAAPNPAESGEFGVLNWLLQLIKAQIQRLLNSWRNPVVAALGSAMLVGQMGLLAFVVKQLYTVQSAQVVVPYSGSQQAPSKDAVLLQVIFKDKATIEDIRNTLAPLQAQVVGGPSALGIWEIQISKTLQDQTIQKLMQSPVVHSVQLP
jgi:hypothetical protein